MRDRRWIGAAVATLVALAMAVPVAATPARPRAPGQPTTLDPATATLDNPYVAGLYPQIPNATRPWENASDGNRKLMQRARETGVTWVYTWLAWSDIEKAPGVYSWANLDRYVTDAHDEGMNLVLQVMVGAWGNPQPWAGPVRTNPRHPDGMDAGSVASTTSPLPEDLEPLRAFWAALVDRYKPGGTLARLRGWEHYGVRVWEVENEPDSMPWWGRWSKVPKDFAAYLAAVEPVIKSAYPQAIVSAPALAQGDNNSPVGRLNGIPWLDEVLRPGDADSDWASDTYRELGRQPGAGPFIDEYSFHLDAADVTNNAVGARAQQLHALLAARAADGVDDDPSLYYSEGNTLQYQDDARRFARGQTQLTVQVHAAGVDRMLFDFGSFINNDPWPQEPLYKAAKAVTRFLPAPRQVTAAPEGTFDAERVVGYVRTDPVSGNRTWFVWARNATGDAGAPFTVRVPVTTPTATLVDGDWNEQKVSVADGAVEVTLVAADPSPVVIVAEQGDLACTTPACRRPPR